MILLTKQIPKIYLPRVEIIKINCNYNSYSDIALFWTQDDNRALISMLDGNMVIYNNCADIEELREFISVISPISVFSDEHTLKAIFGNAYHRVNVMKSEYAFKSDSPSDQITSDEIYNLLDVDGLQLPPYEYFAVDFCHRLNHGHLKYYAQKNLCAAIGISDGQAVLVNGIASHKKGMGSVALNGLLSMYDMPAVAVCEDRVKPFYEKNNFSLWYTAGYWRKK